MDPTRNVFSLFITILFQVPKISQFKEKGDLKLFLKLKIRKKIIILKTINKTHGFT